MTGVLLYAFAVREEAHAKLEDTLAEYPYAECREEPNHELPYQVWSGPQNPRS